MTGLTQALANFVANPTFGGQEQAACEIAKTGLMDTIATMMAGHDEPVVKIVRQFVGEPPAHGQAPVPFTGEMYSAAQAAMINGTAGHALDYDDVALSGHPSTALVPAILAAGYVLKSSGQDALRAYVVGYLVATKQGTATPPAITACELASTAKVTRAPSLSSGFAPLVRLRILKCWRARRD